MTIANDHNLLFPAMNGSNLSGEFEVSGSPVVLRAFNLQGQQTIRIEQSARWACDSVVWGPLSVCCPVVLSPRITQVVLAVSGIYRAYIDDPDELGYDDVVAVQNVVSLAEPDKTITCCSGGQYVAQ